MLPVRICGNASRHVGCRVALPPTLIRRALPIASKIPLRKPTSCDQARSQSTSTTGPTHPEVIFSGIQPTGVPHLGNYLGALKQWVDLQNSVPPSTELLYCVVDLHAITQPQDPNDLRRRRQDTMAMLLAVGLKAERCVIFEQSRVAAHSQLMWILSTLAPTNLLARQTQWKVCFTPRFIVVFLLLLVAQYEYAYQEDLEESWDATGYHCWIYNYINVS